MMSGYIESPKISYGRYDKLFLLEILLSCQDIIYILEERDEHKTDRFIL